MSILSYASDTIKWRAYEYHVNKRVKSWKEVKEDEFEGFVSGRLEEPYYVHIHMEKPLESTCSCPYAEGNKIICKHKVALLFAVHPQEVIDYLEEIDDYDREEEERELDRYYEIVKYVNGLSTSELRDELIETYVKAEKLGKYHYR